MPLTTTSPEGPPRSRTWTACLACPSTTPTTSSAPPSPSASVPALLMSMVHMTGDMGLLEELPKPFMLIAMDLQGAMSEPDKRSCASAHST